MLVVCDTNVLVSGVLNPDGPPGRIVDLVTANLIQLAFDDRILHEYSAVLQRPRFGFRPAAVEALLAYVQLFGTRVTALPMDPSRCPDPKDLPFAEVAVSGSVDYLVTGNTAHYRFLPNYTALVIPPAEFVRKLAEQGS
ncbi:MAG: putative toxin-antitoxin system toxin component, PIN family [Chloroflexi bacterium]|nr:putative toxin-antitoxin system toxin component, PIN family [Chloroflexota bacterium]